MSEDPWRFTQYLTSSGNFSITRDWPALTENVSRTSLAQPASDFESRQFSTNTVNSHPPDELLLHENSPRIAPSSGIRFACTSMPWSVFVQPANATTRQPISGMVRMQIAVPLVWPNVRAKRATTAGRQARAGKNVQSTTGPGLVACRWRSA